MITVAFIGVAVGAVLMLGTIGVLAYAGIRKEARSIWKRTLAMNIIGVIILGVSIAFLLEQLGPCDNSVTC